MNPTLILILAFGLGVVAGLRSMTAPAIVSWAGRLGWLHLEGTPLAFLAVSWVPYVLTALMLGELVADKLPRTPSRTQPGPFIGRILTGGLSAAPWARGVDGVDAIDPELTLRGLAIFHAEVTGGEPIGMGLG